MYSGKTLPPKAQTKQPGATTAKPSNRYTDGMPMGYDSHHYKMEGE
jgi:hypothetical protein